MCDVSWLIHMTLLIHIRDVTQLYVRSGSCDVTWLMSHSYDMTHSHPWHNSILLVTWPIHKCAVTHICVWHDSFLWRDTLTSATWLNCTCDVTHSQMCRDSSVCVTYERVMLHIEQMTWAVTCTCECVMSRHVESCHCHVIMSRHSDVWQSCRHVTSFLRVTASSLCVIESRHSHVIMSSHMTWQRM